MRFRLSAALAIGCMLTLSVPGCRGDETGGSGDGGGRQSGAVDFFACKSSADCVIERQRDCCPCSAGGRQVALNRKVLKAYSAARAARCGGDLLCPQVYLCDDAARAVCRAGRCDLAAGGGVAPAGP